MRRLLLCTALLAVPAQAYMTDFGSRLVERMQARFGAAAPDRLGVWGQSLSAVRGSELQQLGAVNALANRAPWSSDTQSWGEVDYWATPAEFIARNTGDCEDYVIAKYYSLLALGVERSRLRLVYVRALMEGQLTPHMVLAWYAQADAEPLLLDNLDPRLLRASQRPDLSPLFSIGETAAVPMRDNSRTRQISDVTLSRWEALQKRVALERE